MKQASETIVRLLLLCVAVVIAACSNDDPVVTTGGVSGFVYDARSGEPLAGVALTVVGGGKSTSTGSDGQYHLSSLEAGSYQVEAKKANYRTDTRNVSIRAGEQTELNFQLEPQTAQLSLSTRSLDFNTTLSTRTFDIRNTGLAPLTWQLSEQADWITCQPASGTVQPGESASVVVSVSREGKTRGSYDQVIAVSSNGGSDELYVHMQVQGMTVSITPESFDFGTAETTKTLSLTNTSTQTTTVSYTLQSSHEWLRLSKTQGQFSKTELITVSVNREGLSANTYNATITLQVGEQTAAVPVTMTVAQQQLPTVTMLPVVNFSFSTALFQGQIVSVGSQRVSRHGFCWNTTGQPTLDANPQNQCNLGDTSQPKDMSYNAGSLHEQTTYYVRAYAETAGGQVSYSDEQRFTTASLPKPPTVETGTADNIQATQADFTGNIVSLGNDYGLTQYGHCWATRSNPTLDNATGRTQLGTTQTAGIFHSTLTGLAPGTTYHVRAYAVNAEGTAYGDDQTFTTAVGKVALTTLAATDVSHDEATLGGYIADLQGNVVSERGICWATHTAPTTADSHQAATSHTERWQQRVTGLQPTSIYYARAYVKTQAGTTYYGQDVVFQTTREIHAAAVSAVSVVQLGLTRATLTATVTTDGGGTVSDAGFCISLGAQPTTADGKHSAGRPTAAYTLTLTGLSAATTYHVRAYVVNERGTAYGPESTFTTKTTPDPTTISADDYGTEQDWR